MMRSQTWMVFDPDTTETKISYHMRKNKACGYYTGIPPKWEAQAEEEFWTLPKVIVETWDDGEPEVTP